MNILFYGSLKFRNLGAYSVHIYEVLSNLSNLGHDIVPIKTDILANGQQIDTEQQPSLWKMTGKSLRSSTIYELLKSKMIILVALGLESLLCASAIVLIVRRKGKFDVIYRRHSLFSSDYILSILLGIPLVREVNGIIADEVRINKSADRLSSRVINWIEKLSMPKADKIIVVTSKLKEVLHNDYHVPEEKIVVILNGANTDLFHPMNAAEVRRELDLNQRDNYICFTGNLIQWQGIEYLIKAAPLILESYPNTRFLIVGDGVMKEELIQLTEKVGVSDKVIFTGMMPYQKVPLYINASDICVLPKKPLRSGYSPLKLCEYMACQKPVVATRTSGFEVLEEHHAGLLINPENSREFASAIIKLLQDPELREQMGENGRKYVVENRSWESVAKKVAEVCEQTLEERRNKMR